MKKKKACIVKYRASIKQDMLEDIAKGESFLESPLCIRTSTSQIWALHRPCKRLTIYH